MREIKPKATTKRRVWEGAVDGCPSVRSGHRSSDPTDYYKILLQRLATKLRRRKSLCRKDL
jgi:hypothetical protein